MRTLLKNLTVATFDADDRVLDPGFVLIEDARIAMVGTGPDLPDAERVIDARGHVATPGLINTHHHLYQSLTRVWKPAQDAILFDWLTTQYPKWAKLTEEMVYVSALVSLSELVLSGCTTCSDMFYVFPRGSDVRLEGVIRAAQDLGIRMHAGRGSMSLGQSHGGLPPDSVVQSHDEILADTRRVAEAYHDASPGAMLRVDVMPCSPFSVTAELMKDTIALARQYKLQAHTHLAETLDEEAFCLEKFGQRPLAYVADLGWTGEDVYLAHGIHFDDEELKELGRTRTAVAHCPSSNMRLGSGICRVKELQAAGARVGLGVDGSSSNDCNNLLLEARQAMLLGRLRYGMSYSAVDALKLATQGSAAVLNRPELGTLAPGQMADLAVYDVSGVAHAGAVAHDPVAALIFCQPARPSWVFVNGQAVVDGGQVTTIDLEKIVARHNELARQIVAP